MKKFVTRKRVKNNKALAANRMIVKNSKRESVKFMTM